MCVSVCVCNAVCMCFCLLMLQSQLAYLSAILEAATGEDDDHRRVSRADTLYVCPLVSFLCSILLPV